MYKGDGVCDDDNNNEGCDWDGGDCCLAIVKKDHCKECACKDPDGSQTPSLPKCGNPMYKGDGVCDDDNNNEGCDWDGGDCCLAIVKKDHCKECACKDPDGPRTP